MINKRAKLLIDDINESMGLPQDEWNMWSGKFNRHLRGIISNGNTEDKKRFRFAFTYWQVCNKKRNLSELDIKGHALIESDLKTFKSEAIYGKPKTKKK